MEKGVGDKKLPTTVRRKRCVANHQPMTVVGVPGVVVLETVDVGLELATINVGVCDKQERYVGGAIYATGM
jgi:hypothetical protein